MVVRSRLMALRLRRVRTLAWRSCFAADLALGADPPSPRLAHRAPGICPGYAPRPSIRGGIACRRLLCGLSHPEYGPRTPRGGGTLRRLHPGLHPDPPPRGEAVGAS